MTWFMEKDDVKMLDEVDEAFQKDMLLLENDMDALGWDLPARLYAIIGTPGNYGLALITEMGGHPVDWLREAVTQHGGFPPDAAGVAVAIEGWRHPVAQDFETDFPDHWQQLVDLAIQCDIDPVAERERFLKHTNNALHTMFTNVPPSQNPMRREIRSVMVLMRDDRGGAVNRTRGHDAEFGIMAEYGRMVDAMRAVLTGIWPDDECMNHPTPDRH